MAEPSLSDRAYEIIKNAIITCELMPGEQVAQPQLAEKLGIGLTPIRDALQRLSREGFVQSIPRSGYVVSPITLSDIKEIFELRSILEASAVRLAARRGTDEQLQKIYQESFFTYKYHDRKSYSEFLIYNASFHKAIAEVAGNKRLIDAINKILGELNRVFHLGLDVRDSAQEMRDEHIALAKELCSRNEEQAAKVVVEQIERSQRRVLDALMSSMQSGVSTPLSQNIGFNK